MFSSFINGRTIVGLVGSDPEFELKFFFSDPVSAEIIYRRWHLAIDYILSECQFLSETELRLEYGLLAKKLFCTACSFSVRR